MYPFAMNYNNDDFRFRFLDLSNFSNKCYKDLSKRPKKVLSRDISYNTRKKNFKINHQSNFLCIM